MAVAHENKFHASPRDGYVHTAQVVQEADLSVLVAPHQTNEDDVAFLPLESVYSVYAQQGLKKASRRSKARNSCTWPL